MMLAAPATAQDFTDITSEAGKPFRHANSGIDLPATLDGIARTAVRQIGTQELDIVAAYEQGDEYISIYVTRLVAGSVPIWFDRARIGVEQRRSAFGIPAAVAGPVVFTPPGQTVASGMAAAWSIEQRPLKGTLLAILPVGGWMMKLRYSSGTHGGGALRERLPAVLAALALPPQAKPAPAAVELAACTTPLALKGNARPVRDKDARLQSALLGGLLAGLSQSADAEPATPVTWCRDATPLPVGGVYRANGATDGYLIALSDAGRGISVSPDALSALLAEKKQARPRWAMSVADMDRSLVYAPLDRLPPPTQALSLAQSSAPVSVATTWGRQNVQLEAGALK